MRNNHIVIVFVFIAAVACVVVGVAVDRFLPGWGVLVAVLTGTFIGVWIVRTSLHSLAGFFVDTGTYPLDYIIRSLRGKAPEKQAIEAPKGGVQVQSPFVYGPRIVTVKPNAAVVMVRGSRVTRVEGPGVYNTQPLEYVERVYNLQPIHKTYHFQEVLTLDNTPLQVEVSITYGIQVGAAARLGETELSDPERAALRVLTTSAPDWEVALRDIVEKNIRRKIGRRDLRQVLAMSDQLDIQGSATVTSRGDLGRWGLALYELHIVSIQPDNTVINASLDKWLVQITNETLAGRELGRGTAWAGAINAIASAYSEAQGLGLPDDIIYRELVRRLFEQAAMDPNARSLLQSEMSRMLARRDVDPRPPGQ